MKPATDIIEGKVTKYRKGQGSTIIEEEEESNSLEDGNQEGETKPSIDQLSIQTGIENSDAHTPGAPQA